jgi:hypothetical protein
MNLRGWLFGSASSPVKTSAPANDEQKSDNANSGSAEILNENQLIKKFITPSDTIQRFSYQRSLFFKIQRQCIHAPCGGISESCLQSLSFIWRSAMLCAL